MNDIPIHFWAAAIMAVVHMVLCQILLMKLKRKSTKVYEDMGSPHLLWNNTPRTTWLFWKWMFSSAPNRENKSTIFLVWIIRMLTILFAAWFFIQGQLFVLEFRA